MNTLQLTADALKLYKVDTNSDFGCYQYVAALSMLDALRFATTLWRVDGITLVNRLYEANGVSVDDKN